MSHVISDNQYATIYKYGMEVLTNAQIAESALDARLLLEYVCGTDRNTLLVHPDRLLEEKQVEQYLTLLEKRAAHIPLQHLTGEQDFMGLTFLVNEYVLIPRQDTEILVEEAMKYLHDGMKILDMCTGSGCILLSLLHYSNDCTGVGVDYSKEALEIARQNANQLGLDEQGTGKAAFVWSDLFKQVEGIYDMIVSNPPYIASAQIETLMPEVKDHEPRMALDGTEDGLFFYRTIIEQGSRYLTPGGYMLFEIGYDQGLAVSDLMKQAGYKEVEIIKDYAGLDRVVCGYKAIL